MYSYISNSMQIPEILNEIWNFEILGNCAFSRVNHPEKCLSPIIFLPKSYHRN